MQDNVEEEILSIMGRSDKVSIVERIRPSVYHGQIQKEIFINEDIRRDVS